MGIRVFKNGWRVCIGPAYFRWFWGIGGRLTVSFSHALPLCILGFNQRTYHLFWREGNVWK